MNFIKWRYGNFYSGGVLEADIATTPIDPNAELSKFLHRYCTASLSPGYAVMLSGPWGSGKTWFVERFRKCLSELVPEKPSLYVSLFGVAKIADIEDQFFKQIHPKLANENIQKGWSIFKGLLKGALKIDLDGDGKDDGTMQISIPDLGKWASTAGAVLIFDDLERVAMQMDDIWGYINQFVEHEGYRVIVIANEEKYIEQKPGFTSIKEKVVGRTFEIRPDVTSAINHFLQEVADDDAHKVLLPRQSLILEVFERAKYGNLRQLRQAILDFTDLWNCLVSEDLKRQNEFLDRLVQDVVSIGIEYRAGIITIDQIQDIGNGSRRLRELIGNNGKAPLPPKPADIALQRHDLTEVSKLALLSTTYSAFFARGHLNEEDVKQALNRSRYLIDAKTPSWQKLWHRTSLSDADFTRHVNDVYRRFCKCEYKEDGELLHVVGILIDLAMSGLHRNNKEKMLALARKVVVKLDRQNLLEIGPIEGEYKYPRQYKSAYGMQFMQADTPEFADFVKFYRERKEEARKPKMAIWAKQWMDELASNPTQWALRLRGDGPSDRSWFLNQPILAYSSVATFCKLVRLLDMDGIQAVCGGLRSRYETIGHYEWHLAELSFLRRAHEGLQLQLKNRKKLAWSTFGLRDILLPELAYHVQRLEEYREKVG